MEQDVALLVTEGGQRSSGRLVAGLGTLEDLGDLGVVAGLTMARTASRWPGAIITMISSTSGIDASPRWCAR